MRRAIKPGAGSSYLVSLPAIIFFAVFAAVCVYFEFALLSGISLFLLILSGSARAWGSLAMDKVELSITADRTMLYPGETATVNYRIENGKSLPLIWLELAQDMPVRKCFMPGEGFEEGRRVVSDGQGPNRTVPVLLKGFSFLMGRSALDAASAWHANCRGQYSIEGLFLRSGDGFGLARTEKEYAAQKMPVFSVFPRTVPVDVSIMLRDQWDCSAGTRGYVEDMTVLRGLRPYQETDSWKRINWRIAAKQDEIHVNLYETIRPRSAHFVFDGESFCGMSPGYSEMEAALEVLGSVITELYMAGVFCGLSLPKSKRMPPLDIAASPELSDVELLYYLSAYDCLAEVDADNEPVPSCFDIRATAWAATGSGKTYIITRDAKEAVVSLLPHFERNRTVLLPYDAPGDETSALGTVCRCLMSLKKEEAK